MNELTSIFSTPYPIGEELTVAASDLLHLPEHVHLRLVNSAAGGFGQIDGRWPIICYIRPYEHPDTGESLVLVGVADEPPEEALVLKPDDFITVVYGRMNIFQERALRNLCERYKVPFDPSRYFSDFSLPKGHVAGWIGEPQAAGSIYVGCSPEGQISS
jgi:hypothetical protein